MKTILFIDDQRFFCKPYIEQLEKVGLRVQYCDSATEGHALLLGPGEFEALILDVMMPPPADAPPVDEIAEGNTGLWLLKEVLPIVLSRPLPVVMLTNRTLAVVQEFVSKLPKVPKGLIDVRFKADVSNLLLPQIVQKQIALWREPARLKS